MEKDNITASGAFVLSPLFLSGQEVLEKAFGEQSEMLAPKAPLFQQLQHGENGTESLSVIPVMFPCLSVYSQLLCGGVADTGWHRLLKVWATWMTHR